MKIKLLTTALLVAVLSASISLAASAPAKEIVIVADNQMKFSVTRIEAQPGQSIHVTLKNEGTFPKGVMGHNWILLKAGDDPARYAGAAISAASEDYQPKALAEQVIAAIPLLGPKQQGETTFAAPTAPGTYAFLCTFPGHFQVGMHGELIVK